MSGYPYKQKAITELPCSHLPGLQQWLGKLHHSHVQGIYNGEQKWNELTQLAGHLQCRFQWQAAS